MKRTAALGLLLSITLTSWAPLKVGAQAGVRLGQKAAHAEPSAEIRAVTDGSGVLVRWQMKSESEIVGYNVYRVHGESREKVNSSIIRAGQRAHQKGVVILPEQRQFFDRDGQAGQHYEVECLRPDGSRQVAGNVLVTAVQSLELDAGVSSDALLQAAQSTNHSVERGSPNLTPTLSDLVAAYTPDPDTVNQRVVASKAGAKIAVKRDGFYKVTSAELQAANFPVDSDSSKWRLFTNGVEQSIIVGANNAYIEFYGRGVDFPETDTRVYYLISDTVPGKRISTRIVRSVPGSPTAKNFRITAEKKDRRDPNFELFNGDEENYLGALFDTGGTIVRFDLSGVDFSEPTAQIKISLFGHSENAPHRVLAKINGHPLPPIEQFGRVFYSEAFAIPTVHLNDGQNELELASALMGDYNIFDKVEVTYRRNYISADGKVSFYSPGGRTIDIEGFQTPSVRVFDTTFDGHPVLLSIPPIEEGPLAYRARIPTSRMMVGYAVENSAILTSPSVTPNLPSSLSAASNAADMLIISHSAPAFKAAAESWAAYRRSPAGGAFNTKVVDLADIFDEFNFGMVRADAIKNFLKYANDNWATRPKYVLLIGDASDDPRNYTGAGNFNFVPSRTVSFIEDESLSDEYLADFDGDDAAEIAIGRIPARTAAQITTAYNKMVTFEANQLNFNRGVLFAHDAPIGYDFAALNQRLIQRLPAGTPTAAVSATQPNAPGVFITEFKRGNTVVNYSGHGASSFWASSNFFGSNAVPELTNLQNPSVVTMLTCLSGHFGQASRTSLAEALLFSEVGGAAATWASTGSTTADVQSLMAERFFEKFNGSGPRRLGDMARTAKTETPSGRDVKLSWAILGDPAMRMP